MAHLASIRYESLNHATDRYTQVVADNKRLYVFLLVIVLKISHIFLCICYVSVFYDAINFVFTFLYVYLHTKILANFYGLNSRLYIFVPSLLTIIPFTDFRFPGTFLVVNCAVYMSVLLPGLVDIRFLFLVN
jgi:hypothetical protein